MSERVAVGDPTTRGTATEWLPTPPTRIGPVTTNPLGPSEALEHHLVGGSGRWSNADVYLSCPADWLAENPEIRLYATTNGGESLVASTTIAAAGLQLMSDGGLQGIVLEGRGHPASGWSVRLVTAVGSVAILASAQLVLECWGQESTPEGVGPTPGNVDPATGLTPQGIADQRVPYRAAWLMGYPWGELPNGGPGQDAGPWLPVNLNPATGALIVEGAGGGGVFIVSGDVTPSDDFANPTDAIPAFSFLAGWDGATWDRIRANPNSATRAALALGALETNAVLYAADRSGGGGITVGQLQFLPTSTLTFAPGADRALIAAALGWGVELDGSDYRPVRVDLAGSIATPATISERIQIVGAVTQIEDPANAGQFRSAKSAFTAPTSTLTSVQAVQPVGQFTTAQPVATNGQITPAQTDAAGNVLHVRGMPPLASVKAIPNWQSAGTNAGSAYLISAVPSQLLSLWALANAASFLQLHNLAVSPPALNAVPILTFYNNGSAQINLSAEFFQGGFHFSAGIVLAWSAQPTTYVAANPAVQTHTVGWRT